MSHHGDPEVEGVDAEEPEVEVLEEPEVEVLEEGRPEDGRRWSKDLEGAKGSHAAGDRRPYGDTPAPCGLV